MSFSSDTAHVWPRGRRHWPEVESRIYSPGGTLLLAVSVIFLLIGGGSFLAAALADLEWPGTWIAPLLASCFLLFGLAVLWEHARRSRRSPTVRHADPSVLPEVSRGPLVREGAVVDSHVTHELLDETTAWRLVPSQSKLVFVKWLVISMGIVCYPLGILLLHYQAGLPWPLAVVSSGVGLLFFMGPVAWLAWMITRSSYLRQTRLSFYRDRDVVEVDVEEELDLKKVDSFKGINIFLLGTYPRRQFRVSREQVAAVQLCPYYFRMGQIDREDTYAVQGVLVIWDEAADAYERVPLLLSAAIWRSTLLMRDLAAVLEVPYLFSADYAGWQAEKANDKQRPRLKAGGIG